MSGLGLLGIGFGFRRGIGDGRGGGLRGGAAFGLEAIERVQGAVEGALRGIDAALEEREVVAAADEIQAHAVGVVAHAVGSALVVPDFGVGERVAAKQPVGVDEGGDEEGLFGSGGFPVEEVLIGEGAEFRGVFRGDDLGAGIEAGFEGVGTGGSLALGGARASRFL
ncbi:MAG TPA: hypothetical protein VGZ73_23750 [Bryobacteraceae bacterium]|nr:hypothetical protein [Bryobacteraceae bacterium]